MIKNHDRKFKLGMHSYTLHLSGFGGGKAGDSRNSVNITHLNR
jgi:hypothetical protein